MLLVQRPKTPKDFNRDCRQARADILKITRPGGRPKSEQFTDTWSDYKSVLAAAQHDRCGYCDCDVLTTGYGTVDHFRPKAEIKALLDDPLTEGKQSPHSASLPERKTQLVHELGYHWLAYAWNNYVFACILCNGTWKRTLFPVATHPRCCPPRPRGHEEPLLLNCYRSLRPSEHLQFNPDGSVEPLNGSQYGYETIRTVGLDREPLRNARRPVAARVHKLMDRFARGDVMEQAEALDGLKDLGTRDRAFAGVVRAIVEVETGFSWDELMQL